MGGASIEDQLPRISSELDATARDFIHRAAMARQTVRVPLDEPPMEGRKYELAVTTPGFAAPLILLATRVGPRTATGYPLLLGVPPAAARDRRVGRELAGGKLVIEARVGQGGVGTVYRARHRDLRMNVAVKVLHESFTADPDFVRRFHAEALSASRLDHPNLTRVLDFGQEDDGLLYLAMEYLDGPSLRDMLEKYERLALPRATHIMIQVCTALTHAHARDIVHRDIKPENLVLVTGLDDDGNEMQLVKVCDFGIAHRARGNIAAASQAGTPDYMSPEQFRDEEPDAQTDVYACGVVLYELLTGEVPITGTAEEIVALQHDMRFEPPSVRLPGLDPAIDRVIERALAPDKAARYANMRDLRTDLRTCAGESGPSISGPPGAPTLPPRASIPQAPPVPDKPEWLTGGNDYLYASMIPPMPTSMPPPAGGVASAGAPRSPSYRPQSLYPSLPVEVPQTIEPLIRKLAETKDPQQFASVFAPLAPKIRAVVEQGHPATLFHLRNALEQIANEPPGLGNRTRAETARPLFAIFSDETALAAIAEKSLDPLEDRGGTATKVIVRGGKGAAYALYRARVRTSDYEARQRFVANLRQIGRPGLPVIRAALEKLELKLSVAGAAEICQDLLRSLPADMDEGLRALVIRLSTREDEGVAAIAAALLGKRG